MIGSILAARGFDTYSDDTHAEAFDGRVRTWQSGREMIRVVWNGKEQAFVLEASDEPDALGRPVWMDLDLRHWEPGFRHDLVLAQLRTRLIEYLG